ncbi:MAG: glycine cleavage system protein GcvH [Pseudomonadota bacterium]
MAVFPEELKYSKDHVWVRLDEDGNVTVGITDSAQEEMGEIVYVEVPEEGDDVTKDEMFGSVESSKTVNDLFAPISGTVVEVNTELIDSPEIINEEPYGEGWIARIKPSTRSELRTLFTADEYEEHIKEESEEDEDEEEEESEEDEDLEPLDDDDDEE